MANMVLGDIELTSNGIYDYMAKKETQIETIPTFPRFEAYRSNEYAPTDRRFLYRWRGFRAYVERYRYVAWHIDQS